MTEGDGRQGRKGRKRKWRGEKEREGKKREGKGRGMRSPKAGRCQVAPHWQKTGLLPSKRLT